MKKSLIFFTALIAFNAVAQNAAITLDSTQSKYFVNLSNGKTIYTNDLKSDYSYYKGSYLMVENRDRYDLENVKSYLSSDGFFQKFPIDGSNEKPSWYRKEEKNRLNIYSKQELVRNYYAPIYLDDPAIMLATSYLYSPWYNNTKNYYFQVGDKSPQKFGYDNLLNVVRSNPESLKVLEQGHTLSAIRPLLVVVGLGLIVGGAISSYCNNEVAGECEKVKGKGTGYLVGGLVLCAVPLVLTKPSKKYREAVYIFNK
jgi:hypothetical protein